MEANFISERKILRHPISIKAKAIKKAPKSMVYELISIADIPPDGARLS